MAAFNRTRRLSFTAVQILLCLVQLPGYLGGAQSATNGPDRPLLPEKLAIARGHLKQGKLNVSDINALAEGDATDALPEIKRVFEDPTTATDAKLLGAVISKQAAASAIVRLGEKNSEAWDYLVEGVSDLLSSTRPSSFNFDADGKPLPDDSPEFLAFAKAHHMSEEELSKEAKEQFSVVLYLGASHDKRTAPLLRSVLSAPQTELVLAATEALRELGDIESIPYIVEACRRLPRAVAEGLAITMQRFNDPKADEAAKEFLPAEPPKEK